MPRARRCQARSREQREAPDPASDRGAAPASPRTSGGRGPDVCSARGPPARRSGSPGATRPGSAGRKRCWTDTWTWRRCPRGQSSPCHGRPRLMQPPGPARRDAAEDAQWSRWVVPGEGRGEGAVRPARHPALCLGPPAREEGAHRYPLSDPPLCHPAPGPRRAPQPSPGAQGYCRQVGRPGSVLGALPQRGPPAWTGGGVAPRPGLMPWNWPCHRASHLRALRNGPGSPGRAITGL